LATKADGNAKARNRKPPARLRRDFCRQKLLDFLARGFWGGGMRLTIHAENLLPTWSPSRRKRVWLAGPAFYSRNSGNVHAFAAEIFKKRVALTLANGSDGKHARSQVGQLFAALAPPPGRSGSRGAQNQHRRLARDREMSPN